MIPQFDTSWYIGEIFWIFLSFGFMFLGIRYFIFPMLLDIFSERKQIIDENLSIAEVVNQKAEKLMHDYNAHLLAAREEKEEIINETYQDLQKFAVHVEAEHEEIFRLQIDESEKQMQLVREKFQKESDNLAVQISERLADKLAHNPTNKEICS
ncbi:MAG: ATP synthase F0 subunit B [Alphaproteobacteria bacterium]|nr:ATP synthase F0 subunit B [Alphaproteobacteria bacterium]